VNGRLKTFAALSVLAFFLEAPPGVFSKTHSAPEPAERSAHLRSDHFSIHLPAANERLGREILGIAESARTTVLENMPESFDELVGLVWCSTEREFYSHLGDERRHLLAVAVPSIRRIYLNGEQLRRLDPRGLRRALIHEFVHIYIGRRVPRSIPLWLNEGLAMYVAQQWNLADAVALARDSLFGALYTPDQLTERFPANVTAQERAYRQSYSMTAFFIEQRYPKRGVRGLVADLIAEKHGGPIHSMLFDPKWQASFDKMWRRQSVRPGRLILLATSTAMFWFLVTCLCIYAYRKKRLLGKRTEARWALEEEFGYDDDGFDD